MVPEVITGQDVSYLPEHERSPFSINIKFHKLLLKLDHPTFHQESMLDMLESNETNKNGNSQIYISSIPAESASQKVCGAEQDKPAVRSHSMPQNVSHTHGQSHGNKQNGWKCDTRSEVIGKEMKLEVTDMHDEQWVQYSSKIQRSGMLLQVIVFNNGSVGCEKHNALVLTCVAGCWSCLDKVIRV